MRKFLLLDNLWHAMILSGIVTIMSVPRIIVSGFHPQLYIPFAFICMTLVCGMVTAWSSSYGLKGLFRSPRETLIVLAVCAVLICIIMPIQHFILSPAFRQLLAEAGNNFNMEMHFPDTIKEWFALVLWVAGFQTIFLIVAPVCFFTKLAKRQWIALVATVLFHVFVSMKQFADSGMELNAFFFLFLIGLRSLASCLIFIKGGLIPTMFFSASIQFYLLFGLL